MEIKRQEFALGIGLVILLAVAIVRTIIVPDRSRLRPVSVEGLDILSEPIGQGQRIVREKTWNPPANVYLLGWNYRLGPGALGTDPILTGGGVRDCHGRTADLAANAA